MNRLDFYHVIMFFFSKDYLLNFNQNLNIERKKERKKG